MKYSHGARIMDVDNLDFAVENVTRDVHVIRYYKFYSHASCTSTEILLVYQND